MYMYWYVQVVGLTNSNNLVNSSFLLSLTYHLYFLPFNFLVASLNIQILLWHLIYYFWS